MSRVPAPFAQAFRLLLLGLLLCGVVLKPSLAIAEEMHELLSHAAVAGDGHAHPDAHSIEVVPPAGNDGSPPHDDNHFHLTHCCGQQAAVLPRLNLVLPYTHADSPLPTRAIVFALPPQGNPFRPPIAA